jgi:putative SOS response-associated peptidase YedK
MCSIGRPPPRPVDGHLLFSKHPPRPIKRPPASGEWIRTFAIIATDCNELVADIHDRMPVILAPSDYARWGSARSPIRLMRPFPANLMRMWPISTSVNKPENNDSSDR